MNDIALRIKEWRNALGLSQKEFANLAMIPKRSLQNYEEGKQKPGSEQLQKLSYTGVDLNWLITGQGSPTSKVDLESFRQKRDKAQKRREKVKKLCLSNEREDLIELMLIIEQEVVLMPNEFREIMVSDFLERISAINELHELKNG